MSASAAAPPPPELQLPSGSQDDASSNSSEGSKKRAISEVAEDSAAPPIDGSGDGKGPAKKKTKLTDVEMEEKKKEKEAREKEKEDKRKEKEAKEKEKEAEKATKKAERDEKKRVRDEEKKKKDEEKKKKDDEKKKKDDEKKKKDEEKAKKDKAQTRLQNFFARPSGPPSSPAKSAAEPPGPVAAALAPERKEKRSDYERAFHSFFVKPNVTVAPPHYFPRDDVYRATMKDSIDQAMSLPKDLKSPRDQMQTVPEVGTATSEQIAELLHIPLHKRGRRGKLLGYTTKDLLARINTPDDSSLPPITDQIKEKLSKEGCAAIYLKLLNSLPNKFLRFAEDVRPPYSGTFTRYPTTPGLRKGRNPFQRTLPRITYDYDSEAEWEEGALDEDGEELLSDNEEEDEEAESLDDEMDEFLDDEEDDAKGRHGQLAALVPLSSGLCWEDEDGRNSRAEFGSMKMEVLIEGVSGPIDPFSTIYWNPPPKNTKSLANFLVPVSSSPKPSTSTSMEPPRLPLAVSTRPQVTNIALGMELGTPKKGRGVALVPEEDLDAFKCAVEGSNMTKAGLIEVLKKQFPKIGKESIKQTLGKVAARVGDKEKDKRWVLI